MAAVTIAERPTITAKDFQGPVDPDWCPGCGDFGVLNSLKKALAELGKAPHEVITISGIGCSSNLPGFIHAYGMHTLHGRSVPVATGVQLANHDLTVIVTGGDGDGYGIGVGHLIHAMRRNVNLLYIVMNNEIYGLTTGQTSPTSLLGMQTKSNPYGNMDMPLNPLAMAISGGATWVGRGFSGEPKQLSQLIKAGIEHNGFSLLDVFSPCVTYNKDQTYPFFKKRVKKLEDQGHDPTDWRQALEKAFTWSDDEIPIGLFFENHDRPALHETEPVLQKGGPLVHQSLGVSAKQGQKLRDKLM